MFPLVAQRLDLGDWFFIAVWFIGLAWTWVDTQRRVGRTLGRLGYIVLALLPIAGPLVYALHRLRDSPATSPATKKTRAVRARPLRA